MKLKGTVEIEESNYKKALELAFTDYLEDGAQTPELFKGYDIVIDNTNLNKKVLDNYRALVIAHGNHAIEFKDFFDTPLSVCIERDKNRDLQVTEKVIRNFYNNYKDKYPLNGN